MSTAHDTAMRGFNTVARTDGHAVQQKRAKPCELFPWPVSAGGPPAHRIGPPAPLNRSTAIFRVFAVATGFEFNRTLSKSNATSGAPAIDRFGPYATRRAAHELAQRAAERFQAENPHCVVGVVAIDPAPEPASVPQHRLREAINERRLDAKRRRQRERYERIIATPEGRERMSERSRKRYAEMVATPEGRERQRERWRTRPRPTATPKVCTDARNGVIPTCQECGKPTGFYHGRPLRFCARTADEKRSGCLVRHSNKLRTELVKGNPELRLQRSQKQREWNLKNPEKRREKLRRDQERRRNSPHCYAAKLAAERQRKARVRAQEKARNPAMDLPSGSVLLTASPRAIGRDLLASIYAVVPAKLPPSLRMDIISETALLILEGDDLTSAVAKASNSIKREDNRLRYAKPIDDCFWLADEIAVNWEASL